MTTFSFLPYARQSINAEDIQAVGEALAGPTITRGSHVDAFEQAVAEYCGAQYAVAFNSGTSALMAACFAADLKPQDRVITTPNTFVASVTAGMHLGATPIFVDIDRETGNLNLEQVESNLHEFQSSRGRTVILPVHFAGIPVDMERLYKMIPSPDTLIIEDAAHALGSRYLDGQKVGCCAWSDMTMLSFHPAKTITTGEGGMVLTNDRDLYHRLRRFRNNGIEKDPAYLEEDLAECYEGYYEVVEMTGNYNFTDPQGALGLSQLKRIDQFVAKRRELMRVYRELFHNLPDLKMFTSEIDERTAFHICVVQIDFAAYGTSRVHVMAQLKHQGIGTQMHYIPVYRHPFFKNKSGDIKEYFPQMEAYFAQALTLPLYFEMTVEDVKRVVNTLRDILVAERQKKFQKKGRQKASKTR